MVPFESLVVSQDPGWSQKEDSSTQRAVLRFAREQDRREADSIRSKAGAQTQVLGKSAAGAGIFRVHQHVLASWFKCLDLGEHPLCERGIAGGEGDDDGLGVLAESLKDKLLERAPRSEEHTSELQS